MRLVRVYAWVLLLVVAGATAAGAATIEVDGRDRTFEMYAPAKAPRPLPLLVVLHGGGGTSAQMRRYTDFDRIASRDEFIVVYPQALNGHWNDGRAEIANIDRSAARSDDVAFLLAVIDTLVDRGMADRKRVFVAGLSNGGMMALHLACTVPERIGGVAVVAGNQPVDVACEPDRAVPIMFFHGTADRFVPYDGGEILQWANIDRGRVLSADATVEQWLHINGCSGPPNAMAIVDHAQGANVSVEETTFEPCDKAPVRRFVCKGGGHTWPGARLSKAGTALLGAAATGLNASEEIWSFFQRISSP